MKFLFSVFRFLPTADSHTWELLYTNLGLTAFYSRRNKVVRFGINYEISIPRELAPIPKLIHVLLNQAVYVLNSSSNNVFTLCKLAERY